MGTGLVIVSGSPSGSLSFASGSTVAGRPASACSVSSTATGGWFVTPARTTFVAVTVSMPSETVSVTV